MNNLQITEYKDIRVLTTQQIAEAYGTDNRVISNNYNRNKDRYTEGKHYICLEGEDKRGFINHHQIDDGSKKASKLYLWTEKGAFLHAKSLGTDEAWEVYERLVDFYFNKQKPLTIPEQIQILAQGNIELEKKVDSINKDLQDFKRDLPLLAVECEKITKAVGVKGAYVLGGKDSEAYKDHTRISHYAAECLEIFIMKQKDSSELLHIRQSKEVNVLLLLELLKTMNCLMR